MQAHQVYGPDKIMRDGKAERKITKAVEVINCVMHTRDLLIAGLPAEPVQPMYPIAAVQRIMSGIDRKGLFTFNPPVGPDRREHWVLLLKAKPEAKFRVATIEDVQCDTDELSRRQRTKAA